MIEYLLTLVLLFVTVLVVSGNNTSVSIGPLVGSGSARIRNAQVIVIIGFISGLIIQGQRMQTASYYLFPFRTPGMVALAFLVTSLIFTLGHFLKTPLSLTMALVGVLLGMSFHSYSAVSSAFVLRMVLLWSIAPLAAFLLSYLANRALGRFQSHSIWRRLEILRALLIATSFIASYTLGTNTIGLIVSIAGFSPLDVILSSVAIVAGVLLFSSGEINRIGRELFSLRTTGALTSIFISAFLVEAGTLLSIPVSNSQALSSGVMGVGFSYRTRFVRLWPFAIIILGWIITPLLGFIAGFGIQFFYR